MKEDAIYSNVSRTALEKDMDLLQNGPRSECALPETNTKGLIHQIGAGCVIRSVRTELLYVTSIKVSPRMRKFCLLG